MHQIIAYIKFLLRSTNEHGVHSPFVFNLLTECLYKKENRPGFEKLIAFRKELLDDSRAISVKDFGAGSRVFTSNERKVADIAKNAGISKKRALLLNKLTSYLNVRSALELGTSVGISSAAIASGNQVQLTTIEGCPETANIAREYFEKFGLNNIQLEVGSFEEVLGWKSGAGRRKTEVGSNKSEDGSSETEVARQESETVNPSRSFGTTTENTQLTTDNLQLRIPFTTQIRKLTTDLVFFDGNHQKQATLEYFHRLLPRAHNESVFIFDDIHWSAEMEEAWEEIKAHPEVKISIDTFYWGLIFFRKEQEKEHFVIRL